jgi:signal peptide peptidase SppA
VSERKHVVRRVVGAVTSEPWLIEENKLSQIVELLEMRADGDVFSREEIQARIGLPSADKSLPRVVNGVAVLPVHGVMAPRMNLMMEVSGGTSTQQLASWFQQAMNDPKVSSIVLDIDSPGGTATGNEELAQMIRGARGKKPIKAVATSMMASAAYYVGSAADQVIVSPSAEVGSIGTYMIHGESSRADQNAGITYTVVKAGQNKAIGNEVEPLGSHGRAVLQERVDAVNEQFVNAVAANRGVSAQAVNETFGQGKLFLGTQAVANGLADRVGTLAEVVNELAGAGASGGKQTGSLRAKETNVNEKIMAAMVAKGLLKPESSEDAYKAVLAGFCAGKGIAADSSDDKILTLFEAEHGTPKTADILPTIPKPEPKAETVDAASIKAAERARIEDLTARAKLLGIDDVTLKAAVEGGLEVPQALDQWTKKMSTVNAPVISHVSAEADVFGKAAEEALLHRIGRTGGKDLSSAAESLEYATLYDIAERSLRVGGRRNVGSDKMLVAEEALMGPRITTILKGNRILNAGAEGGGYNRPSDFPNILSNIMGKIMAQAYEFAPTTYRNWAYRLPSVSDFKPKTIIGVGEFPEFPMVPDGKDFPEVASPDEERAFINVEKYGQEFSLTPVMLIDDEMGAIEASARDNVIAAEMKLNRLCVNLLTGNAVAQDGVALFDAAHGNIVTSPSPAPPDTDQLAAMRLLLRSQRGLSGHRALNLSLYGLLIPEDLETVTEKLLAAGIVVVPTAETGAQLFRQGGRNGVQFWVDPMIGEHNTTYYYGFANPTIARPIVYCHMQGFENVRQRSYFNDKNQCRIFQYEARYAAAVRDYRGVVQNPDT